MYLRNMTKDQYEISELEQKQLDKISNKYVDEIRTHEGAIDSLKLDLKKVIEKARLCDVPDEHVQAAIIKAFLKHALSANPYVPGDSYETVMKDYDGIYSAIGELNGRQIQNVKRLDIINETEEAPAPVNLHPARDKATDHSET